MPTKNAMRALVVGGLLGLAPVVAVATPAHARVEDCRAQTLEVLGYAQATCAVVTTPSKFRADANCESDSTGARKWKLGTWHYYASETAKTYCWSGWSIVGSRVVTG
jgi:hypothetical protein